MIGCELIAWPGHRTTAWHHESKAPDIRTWYGGLVDGMRDASGQMYMRNRYYDPATGQFTQPDPIGLAGGLNSYGFANGDPVGYWDPMGLCAWGAGRDAALGNCSDTDRKHAPQEGETPQRLDETQQGKVEDAIANLKGTARNGLSRMLARGQIMTVARARFGRAAGVDIRPHVFGTRFVIHLQRERQEEQPFFLYAADEASWILGHEYGHIEQWRSGALLHLSGISGNFKNAFYEGLNSPNYYLLQQDANIFACGSVVSMPTLFKPICANGGHSPP